MSQLLIELRAGEGGRDAMLFCEELRRVVLAFARHRGDHTQAQPGAGDSRTLTLLIEGDRGTMSSWPACAGACATGGLERGSRGAGSCGVGY